MTKFTNSYSIGHTRLPRLLENQAAGVVGSLVSIMLAIHWAELCCFFDSILLHNWPVFLERIKWLMWTFLLYVNFFLGSMTGIAERKSRKYNAHRNIIGKKKS